jgi:hypothetical protein
MRIYEEKANLHDMKFCNKVLSDSLKGRARLEKRGVCGRSYWILSERIQMGQNCLVSSYLGTWQ